MCDPLVIAGVGLAVNAFSAISGMQATNNAAEQQEQAVQDGLAKDRLATQRQYEEINQTAMDAEAQRHTEYLIDTARLRTAAAESGLAGGTQDRSFAEVQNTAETDMATIEQNRQRQAEAGHTGALAKTTQGNVQLAGIRYASGTGAALQIAGAAANAYSQYNTLSNPKVPRR